MATQFETMVWTQVPEGAMFMLNDGSSIVYVKGTLGSAFTAMQVKGPNPGAKIADGLIDNGSMVVVMNGAKIAL